VGLLDRLGRKLGRKNDFDRLKGREVPGPRPTAQPAADPTTTMAASAGPVAAPPPPIGTADASGDMGTSSNAGTTEQGAYRHEGAQPPPMPLTPDPGPSAQPYAGGPAGEERLVAGSQRDATFTSETGLDTPERRTAQGSDSVAGTDSEPDSEPDSDPDPDDRR